MRTTPEENAALVRRFLTDVVVGGDTDAVSLEWFEKPPGHASPMHDHENEQVCLVLDGELVVHTETESVALGQYDSVLLESNETHRVVNETDELAVGVDVFAPGRSFDFWTDREG